MGEYDITQVDQTDTKSIVKDFSVTPKSTDGAGDQKETEWYFSDFRTYNGYYEEIGELKNAINSFATWVLGQGFEIDDLRMKTRLDKIDGWGEDTFTSILWNMLVVKKYNGDAFAEIIRDEDNRLLNLKPISPEDIVIVVNRQGRIIRYEEITKSGGKEARRKISPNKMFHICNDRTADNIHGNSIIPAIKWDIDAIQEAKKDKRRILHRSTIRIIYVEENDKTRRSELKSNYAEALRDGELMLLPGKKEDYAFDDLTAPPSEHIEWIAAREDSFYRALGIPKVIIGGTAENTEASAKVGVIVFEPKFVREITELEQDLWNQIGVKIKIKKQPSLMDNVQTQEAKNPNQTGFQPNDTTAGSGK